MSANSLPILNLAWLCWPYFELINIWVARAAHQNISLVRKLGIGLIPVGQPTNIRILCERLTGVCALCNNHAGEMFAGLQLCCACDLLYFLKITLRNNFRIGGSKLQLLQSPMSLGKDEARDTIEFGTFFFWVEGLKLVDTAGPSPATSSRRLGRDKF